VDELPLRSETIDLLLGAGFHSWSDFEYYVTATGLTEGMKRYKTVVSQSGHIECIIIRAGGQINWV
jgi:hypothetical protein